MARMTQADLESAALDHFGCLSSATTGSSRRDTRIAERRSRVISVVERYHKVMDENPGMSREDAIRLTVGAFRMIVSFMFPWIGLAMTVAAWLWDYEHANSVVSTDLAG